MSSAAPQGHAVFRGGFHERPAKRARSEALPSPQQQQFYSRPATSHNPAGGLQFNVEQGINNRHRIRQPSQDELEIGEFMQQLARDRRTAPGFDVPPQSYQQHHDSWNYHYGNRDDPTRDTSILFPYPERQGVRFHPDAAPLTSTGSLGQALHTNNESLPNGNPFSGALVQTHTPPEDKLPTTNIAEPSTHNEDPMRDAPSSSMGPPGQQSSRAIKEEPNASTNNVQIADIQMSSASFGDLLAPAFDGQQLESPQSMLIDDLEPSATAAISNVIPTIEMPPPDRPIRPGTSMGLSSQVPGSPFTDNSGLARSASSPIRDQKTLSKIDVNPDLFKVARRVGRPKKLKEATTCAACSYSSNSTTSEVQQWVQCNGCQQWFHFVCAGFKNQRDIRSVDKFYCHNCHAEYGPTTCKKSLLSNS